MLPLSAVLNAFSQRCPCQLSQKSSVSVASVSCLKRIQSALPLSAVSNVFSQRCLCQLSQVSSVNAVSVMGSVQSALSLSWGQFSQRCLFHGVSSVSAVSVMGSVRSALSLCHGVSSVSAASVMESVESEQCCPWTAPTMDDEQLLHSARPRDHYRTLAPHPYPHFLLATISTRPFLTWNLLKITACSAGLLYGMIHLRTTISFFFFF